MSNKKRKRTPTTGLMAYNVKLAVADTTTTNSFYVEHFTPGQAEARARVLASRMFGKPDHSFTLVSISRGVRVEDASAQLIDKVSEQGDLF